MAMSINGAEGMTGTITVNGTTVPAGTGETTLVAAIGSGTQIAIDTANKIHGTNGFALTVANGVVCSLRTSTFAAGSTVGSADMHFKTATVNPGAGNDIAIMQLRHSTAGNIYTVSYVGASGTLRVKGASGSQWDSTASLNPDTSKRVALAWSLDLTTPANSKVRIATFAANSDTVIIDSGWVSLTPTTASQPVEQVVWGRIGTNGDAVTNYLDDLRWDPVSTDLIPYLGSLKPVATLSAASGNTSAPVTVTFSKSLGNANPVTYAIKVEYSANGNFTDTTTFVDTTGGTYQSGTSYSFTPNNPGSYRATPYGKQDPV